MTSCSPVGESGLSHGEKKTDAGQSPSPGSCGLPHLSPRHLLSPLALFLPTLLSNSGGRKAEDARGWEMLKACPTSGRPWTFNSVSKCSPRCLAFLHPIGVPWACPPTSIYLDLGVSSFFGHFRKASLSPVCPVKGEVSFLSRKGSPGARASLTCGWCGRWSVARWARGPEARCLPRRCLQNRPWASRPGLRAPGESFAWLLLKCRHRVPCPSGSDLNKSVLFRFYNSLGAGGGLSKMTEEQEVCLFWMIIFSACILVTAER